MQELQIKVANIKCNGCAATIKTNLERMPGVAAVAVDARAGAVVVTGESLERAPLAARLRELGYPDTEASRGSA